MPIVNASPGDNIQTLINSCTSPSAGNQYDIVLADGNYDQTANITPGVGGINGLQTRDYVNIRSNNTNKETMPRIHMSRPNGSGSSGSYETITLNAHTTLENVKVSVRNGRYPIHINESSGKTSSIFNCVLDNEGCWSADGSRYATYAECGWVSFHGLGVSIAGGSVHTLENTRIIGRSIGGSIGGHNIASQGQIATMNLIGCDLQHPDDGPSIMFESLGSGRADIFNITSGNTLQGPIVYGDNPWQGGATDHNEWRFASDGSNSIPGFYYFVTGGPSLSYRPALPELTYQAANVSGGTIARGKLCAVTAGGIRLLLPSDSALVFAGVAYADITNGATGTLYRPDIGIYSNDLGLSSLTLGQTVGTTGSAGTAIVGGAPTVGTVSSIWAWWQNYAAILATFSVSAPASAEIVQLGGAGVGTTTTTTTTAAPVISGSGAVHIAASDGRVTAFNSISSGELRLQGDVALALGGSGPIRVKTALGVRSIQ